MKADENLQRWFGVTKTYANLPKSGGRREVKSVEMAFLPDESRKTPAHMPPEALAGAK
jgi:hypothetical protein